MYAKAFRLRAKGLGLTGVGFRPSGLAFRGSVFFEGFFPPCQKSESIVRQED